MFGDFPAEPFAWITQAVWPLHRPQGIPYLCNLLLSSLISCFPLYLAVFIGLFLCPKLSFGQCDQRDQAYRVVKSTSTALVCCCQRQSF